MCTWDFDANVTEVANQRGSREEGLQWLVLVAMISSSLATGAVPAGRQGQLRYRSGAACASVCHRDRPRSGFMS